MTCRRCDRCGAEVWIGSNVIGRIGWLIQTVGNDARLARLRQRHYLSHILRLQRGLHVATTLKQMMDAANAAVPRITPAQVGK